MSTPPYNVTHARVYYGKTPHIGCHSSSAADASAMSRGRVCTARQFARVNHENRVATFLFFFFSVLKIDRTNDINRTITTCCSKYYRRQSVALYVRRSPVVNGLDLLLCRLGIIMVWFFLYFRPSMRFGPIRRQRPEKNRHETKFYLSSMTPIISSKNVRNSFKIYYLPYRDSFWSGQSLLSIRRLINAVKKIGVHNLSEI